MRLVLLDPSLESDNGHHLVFDGQIVKEARRRGFSVHAAVNRNFDANNIEGASVIRHFSSNIYPKRGGPDHLQFRRNNALTEKFTDELVRLPQDLFDSDTIVYAPTVNESLFQALVRWIDLFPAAPSPHFCILLMFPPGVRAEVSAGTSVAHTYDAITALSYALAFADPAKAYPNLSLYALGKEHVAAYRELFGRSVQEHPFILNVAAEATREDEGVHEVRELSSLEARRPRVLMYAGDAKRDKGFVDLVRNSEHLMHSGANYVIQANVPTWDPELIFAADELSQVAKRSPVLRFIRGRISDDEYSSLIASADIVVFPYDPVEYANKSSMVLWEAIALEKTVVVPKGTWLERACEEFGAHFLSHDGAAGDLPSVLRRAVEEGPRKSPEARKAGQQIRRFSGAGRLLAKLTTDWGESYSTRCGVKRPDRIDISPAEIVARNLPEVFEGKPSVWLGSSNELILPLFDVGSFRVEIGGPFYVGEDILRSIHLEWGSQIIAGTIELDSTGWRFVSDAITSRPDAVAGNARRMQIKFSSDAVIPGDGGARRGVAFCQKAALLEAEHLDQHADAFRFASEPAGALVPLNARTINLNGIEFAEVSGPLTFRPRAGGGRIRRLRVSSRNLPHSFLPLSALLFNGINLPLGYPRSEVDVDGLTTSIAEIDIPDWLDGRSRGSVVVDFVPFATAPQRLYRPLIAISVSAWQ